MSVTAISANLEFREIQKLWEDYGADEVHDCTSEDFARCSICEKSQEAADMLQGKALMMAELLMTYHELLQKLSQAVIQDVPFQERTSELQQAMLKGISATGELR